MGIKFKDRTIVVRSSSLNEDSPMTSQAGVYYSELNVNPQNTKVLREAINRVIKRYLEKEDFTKLNQILIQQQTKSIAFSGVVFTRKLLTNTPYYVVNYDDKIKKTDIVTSGMGGETVEILRSTPINKIPKVFRTLIQAVQEIEALLSDLTLDIEFSVDNEYKVTIFQVRPLAANSKFPALNDESIEKDIEVCKRHYKQIKKKITGENDLVLSDMAFWNPAELIGDRPNHLAYSLFKYLIMDSAWNEGLESIGYTKVDECLIEKIANKPYIIVNHAFFSLLPANINLTLKKKLVKQNSENLKKRLISDGSVESRGCGK